MRAPLSKMRAVPFALQNRALFEGEKRAKKCPEKGVASRGGKKEKRMREERSVKPFKSISLQSVSVIPKCGIL